MSSGMLSANFSVKEFSCKCGCGLDAIDPLVVRYLQMMRDDINADVDWIALNRGIFKIIINSGCRCLKHNADEYAKRKKQPNLLSPHLPQSDGLCKAVDIECLDASRRFFLVRHGLWWFHYMEWGTLNWIHFDVVRRASGPCVFIA